MRFSTCLGLTLWLCLHATPPTMSGTSYACNVIVTLTMSRWSDISPLCLRSCSRRRGRNTLRRPLSLYLQSTSAQLATWSVSHYRYFAAAACMYGTFHLQLTRTSPYPCCGPRRALRSAACTVRHVSKTFLKHAAFCKHFNETV